MISAFVSGYWYTRRADVEDLCRKTAMPTTCRRPQRGDQGEAGRLGGVHPAELRR